MTSKTLTLTRLEQAGWIHDSGPGSKVGIDLGGGTEIGSRHLGLDALIFTHCHGDHFLAEHAYALGVPVFGPEEVVEALKGGKLEVHKIGPNVPVDICKGVRVTAFEVDHGPSVVNHVTNLGLVIDSTKRFVHMGDAKIAPSSLPQNIDAIYFPTGGNGGTVWDAKEALEFVSHFNLHQSILLPGHTEIPLEGPMAVDPSGARRFQELAGEYNVVVLSPGESVTL